MLDGFNLVIKKTTPSSWHGCHMCQSYGFLTVFAICAGHARLLGSKVPTKLPEVPTLEKMYRRQVL